MIIFMVGKNMTPSEAHDSAWKREPGHDEMVYECWKLISNDFSTFTIKKKDRRLEHQLKGVWMEAYLKPDKGGAFFADILARWEVSYRPYDHLDNEELSVVYVAYEVKPKIYSAGAVVRQMAVQRDRLQSWAAPEYRSGFEFHCFTDAIVKADDGLKDMLVKIKQGRVIVWNGHSLKFESVP